MNKLVPRLALAVVLCLPPLAFAQAASNDPTQAKAPAAALRYQSAFADYKPWQDIKPGPWRELNDRLAPVSASGPAAPADKASAPPAPAHPMHGDHR